MSLHGADVLLRHLRLVVHPREGKSSQFFTEGGKNLFGIASIEMPGAATDGAQERKQPGSNIACRTDDQPEFVVYNCTPLISLLSIDANDSPSRLSSWGMRVVMQKNPF